MAYCDWCGVETNDLIDYYGENLCRKCMDSFDNCICRTCGAPLVGIVIAGECIECQQRKAIEKEKKRSELLEGLDCDIELTSSVEFTEADYERWVTFSVSGDEYNTRLNRMVWLKSKLLNSGWTIEDYTKNIVDLMDILEENYRSVFNPNVVIILKSKNKENLNKILKRKSLIVSKGDILVLKNMSEVIREMEEEEE
ncbi:MAG: hypothetical protein QXD03_02640 [Candidatus Anstonellales archaeon]